VCAATDGSDVVGLAGVGQGEEVAEGYGLGGGPLEVRCLVALVTQILDMNGAYMVVELTVSSCDIVILIFQPNRYETVKLFAFDIASGT
jgi:hypothetical protein